MEDILNLYEPYTSHGSRDRTSDRNNDSTARTSSSSEIGVNGRRQRHSGADPHRRQTRYFQVNFPRGGEAGNFDATQSLEG